MCDIVLRDGHTHTHTHTHIETERVCVCVCMREREREIDRDSEIVREMFLSVCVASCFIIDVFKQQQQDKFLIFSKCSLTRVHFTGKGYHLK